MPTKRKIRLPSSEEINRISGEIFNGMIYGMISNVMIYFVILKGLD